MMGGWRDEWETIAFRQELRVDQDFLRVRIRVERGVVVRYLAQYEAVIGGMTYPVVRHDNAHGAPHRDTLDWEGRVVEKWFFPGKSNAEALDEGIADIKSHWRLYRARFLRRQR